MGMYVVLWKFSGGLETQELLQRVDQVHQMIAALGGEVVGCYAIMGEYDGLGIYELPSDGAMLALLLRVMSAGLAKTVTMKAIPFDQIMGKVGPFLEKLG